ncbi:hypothetical protein GPECTOR_7g1007 [Gonium pectorale]|uniref:Cyclic nucleotide-binding domain-containing protein n=1 Tax=Gonium pectorale TaxID=33097 RepID=A0A150GTD0_GONPE|nr:hypothetical protein GPECTOR_7g1007 [Gonium pectorale]|eukprot:KXZ53117.1 hypothetical protein GPECTOR_7g1007 [Gonium pectorale]
MEQNAEGAGSSSPLPPRQLLLKRALLKRPEPKAHGTGTSSREVANWLSAAQRALPGDAAGATGPARHALQLHNTKGLLPFAVPGRGGAAAAAAGAGSGRPALPRWSTAGAGGSLRRTASTLIERPSLWYRITHVDVRGVVDSLLPIYNPDTPLRRGWDLAIMALVVWTVVTVPLSVSYGMPHTPVFAAINYAITALFAVDLVVNFRTAYYNHQGELMRDSSAIAANYMKVWFWIDLFGTIPFDSIVLWTGLLKVSGGSDSNNTTLAALGFLKAPRMLRLGRLLRFLDRFRNAKIFRIAQLFMAMILISHWLACVWYIMYRFGGKDASEDWAFEIEGNSDSGHPNQVTYYVVSYYYSFLLLVGDNITAYNNFERTFFVVVLIAGTFFYSAVVGQMATLVATMNVAVNRHGQKLLMVQDALRYAGVPERFSEKVQQYFEYLQARSHPGAEGMQFLQDLPSSLHLNVCQFLHRRSLNKVPLFKDCEEGFLSALSLRIRMISLSPSEVIFRVGDVGKEMYIIRKGCVAVTSPSHQMWGLLPAGEVFGEVALLSTGKRTANCTALGFVDLAVLTGPDLQVVMRDYPVSAAMIAERAAERARALQEKSKMWMQFSDDEDNFYDLASGDGEGADGEAQSGGSGDADADSAEAASAVVSSSSSGSGRRSSSGRDGGSGDGAANVTLEALGHDGSCDGAAAGVAGLQGKGLDDARGPLAASSGRGNGRPTSAINGKPVSMAWLETGGSVRRGKAGLGGGDRGGGGGGAAPMGAADYPGCTSTQVEVPRLSLDLPVIPQRKGAAAAGAGAGDGVEGTDGGGGRAMRRPDPQEPSQPGDEGRGAPSRSTHTGVSPTPPNVPMPRSPRPQSAIPRLSHRIAMAAAGAGARGPAGAAGRASLSPSPSPRAPVPPATGPLLLPTSAGSRGYQAESATSRRQRAGEAAAGAAASEGAAAASPQQPPLADRPRAGRQETRQQRSLRRRSMAFWLQEEEEIAAGAGGGGTATASAGTTSRGLGSDADDIPWLAPPSFTASQRRRSSLFGSTAPHSCLATGTGLAGPDSGRGRRSSTEPQGPALGGHHHHRLHNHSDANIRHDHHHYHDRQQPSQLEAQHQVLRQQQSSRGVALHEQPDGSRQAAPPLHAAIDGNGGGRVAAAGANPCNGGGGGGDDNDEGAAQAALLLLRAASSRARAPPGPEGAALLGPAPAPHPHPGGGTRITPRLDGARASDDRYDTWWTARAEPSAAAAAAAAAVAAAIAGDRDWEAAAARAAAASAAAFGGDGGAGSGGDGGGRAAPGPGPVAEGFDKGTPSGAAPPAAAEDSALPSPLHRSRRSSTNVAAAGAHSAAVTGSGGTEDPTAGATAASPSPMSIFGRLHMMRRGSAEAASSAPASGPSTPIAGGTGGAFVAQPPSPFATLAAVSGGPLGASSLLPSEGAILRLTRRSSGVGPITGGPLETEAAPSPFATPEPNHGLAASKLSFFEDTVSKLLDLVAQQDDALARLEARAARAAELGSTPADAALSTSVLGIVAPSALAPGGAGVGAAAAGGSRSLAQSAAAQLRTAFGPPAYSRTGSGLPGAGAAPQAGLPRGRSGNMSLLAPSPSINAAMDHVTASSGAAAESGQLEKSSTSQLGVTLRVRGAARAFSRLRTGQPGPRARSAAGRANGGDPADPASTAAAGDGGGAGRNSPTAGGTPPRGTTGNGDPDDPPQAANAAARASSLTRAGGERVAAPAVVVSAVAASELKFRRAGSGVPGALRGALKHTASGSGRESSATGMASLRGVGID